jgi:hypothetical protein
MKSLFRVVPLMGIAALFAFPAAAQLPFFFSTGAPDGRIGTASRPGAGGKIEIESADDFLTSSPITSINTLTFTGLLTGTTPTIGEVRVEIYRVFPNDSTVPPDNRVPTRANSPSDVEFADRDTAAGNLTFTTTTLNSSFTAANSVLNGINAFPNQTTLGEGPITGSEVQFSVNLKTPFSLPADHYFFIPQVQITGGEFYWLSGQRPAVTPFAPDLQSWIRNANLDPDWLRIGTDIVGGTTPPTFNGAFTLQGQAVPEPGSVAMLGSAVLIGASFLRRRRKRQ